MDALLAEAALDLGVPGPGEFFGDDTTTDPVARVQRVDRLLHEHCLANEAARSRRDRIAAPR